MSELVRFFYAFLIKTNFFMRIIKYGELLNIFFIINSCRKKCRLYNIIIHTSHPYIISQKCVIQQTSNNKVLLI